MGAIDELRNAAGTLTANVDELVSEWVAPALARIHANLADIPAKTINDAVWDTIDLDGCEILLLDTPLMQRLRGVKQLGLANLVFPGATHDRFAHSCGIVEATDRMLTALQKNAKRRSKASPLPMIEPEQRRVVRLAALLHDVGHGPFSHAIEPVVEKSYEQELDALRRKTQELFDLDTLPQTAELIAVLIVASPQLEKVLEHGSFGGFNAKSLVEQVVACVLGARAAPSIGRHVPSPYLTALVSSSIDADKMDYLARDAHHAGLPIAFDTPRLVSRLEVLKCNAQTLPATQEQNIEFAGKHPNQEYFDLGLGDGGVGAFEQMLVNRAFLYDRLYHHHKVRVADAMAQRLVHYAQAGSTDPFRLKHLYLNVPDETMTRLLGGLVSHPLINVKNEDAAALATALVNRDLFVRTFAFRSNLFSGIATESDDDEDSARRELWTKILREMKSLSDVMKIEQEIFDKAKEIAPTLDDMRATEQASKLRPSHIIVDVAPNRRFSSRINTWTSDERIEPPVWSFDQSKWAEVYARQKQTGYVFAPREVALIVSIAAQIVFLQRFGAAVGAKAARVAKTIKLVPSNWYEKLVRSGMLNNDDIELLLDKRKIGRHLSAAQIVAPSIWKNSAPNFAEQLAEKLRNALPQGMSTQDSQALAASLSAMLKYLQTCAEETPFRDSQQLAESDLQAHARSKVSMLIDVSEANKTGGGTTDLVLQQRVLLENKIANAGDPKSVQKSAPFQARRYAIPMCSRVTLTLVAYKPASEAELLRPHDAVWVEPVSGLKDGSIEIRMAVPFGMGVPSRAKAPSDS